MKNHEKEGAMIPSHSGIFEKNYHQYEQLGPKAFGLRLTDEIQLIMAELPRIFKGRDSGHMESLNKKIDRWVDVTSGIVASEGPGPTGPCEALSVVFYAAVHFVNEYGEILESNYDENTNVGKPHFDYLVNFLSQWGVPDPEVRAREGIEAQREFAAHVTEKALEHFCQMAEAYKAEAVAVIDEVTSRKECLYPDIFNPKSLRDRLQSQLGPDVRPLQRPRDRGLDFC